MTNLFFRNTSTQRLAPFQAIDPECVRIYSCGPTVYRRQHLGNLRTYVFSDILRRALEHFGHGVRHVINVTDVGHLTDDGDGGDDKLERAAAETGLAARAIADRVFAQFRADLARLNVLVPHVYCKASEHVADQIALIEKLEMRGFTYRLDDGLYFDTARDAHYGELRPLAAGREHTRVDAANQKREPRDFALWKLSPTTGPRRQQEWPSPWGVGFPGWHIECSAMAIRYLGERIDLHTGGIDHIAVHHTNEIAQSENALGVRPWVNTWLHAGWLLFQGRKIAKSAGEAPCMDELAAWGVAPDAFRYYLSTAHYRAALNLDLDAVRAAQTAWQRLGAVAASYPSEPRPESRGARARELAHAFDAALGRDLDTPQALAVIWAAFRDSELALRERAELVAALTRTLGLTLSPEPLDDTREAAPRAEIEALVRERELARAARDFACADAIRTELARRGVVVTDSANGPLWKQER